MAGRAVEMHVRTCTVRLLALCVAAAASLLGSRPARAEEPLKIIVGAPAGGGTDAVFRAIGRELTESLGENAIVMNVPGAGGTLAVGQMARSTANGRTLAGIISASITAVPYTMRSAFRPEDVLALARLSTAPYAYCVAKEFPANNGREFLDEVKRSPGKYSYGTDGVGGTAHIATEGIFSSVGAKARDVPFKGASETAVALVGGHIDIYVGSIPPMLPHVKSGKAKCLLLSSAEGRTGLPLASGLRSVGLAEREMLLSRVLLAPKGTPLRDVRRLLAALEKAVRAPDVQRLLEMNGEEASFLSGGDLLQALEKEYLEVGRVARSLDLQAK
jgi:tripartite-type tricarboxylate transporter receptor subunit TctC